jgi:hypothetical protein
LGRESAHSVVSPMLHNADASLGVRDDVHRPRLWRAAVVSAGKIRGSQVGTS